MMTYGLLTGIGRERRVVCWAAIRGVNYLKLM